MKTHVHRWLVPTGRFALYLACGLVSVFLLASGYESVYSRPLPFVHTIATVKLTLLSQTYNLSSAAVLKPTVYGQFGKPVTLTIPNAQGSQRLSIATPIHADHAWLARASSMHLLIPTEPLNGNISTQLLYCRASFRTISARTLPETGSNLFVDTDQAWRYVYKVTLAKPFSTTYPYVPSTSGGKGRLIVFCNDPANAANDIIEGDLISVQAITR